MELRRHARFLYQPVLPLGKNRTFVTNSKAHWNLANDAAVEGTVLLKNDGTLPLAKGAKICLFGLGAGKEVVQAYLSAPQGKACGRRVSACESLG